MAIRIATLTLLSTLALTCNVYADEIINNPNLPHPAAAAKAFQDQQKVQRNQNAAKAGAAKSTTQVRPVNPNGRLNEVGRPGRVR